MLKTVLVIDDSKFIVNEIESIVTKQGYEVVGHAKSGEEGIKMYEKLKPDIVTLDIIMPGIDGIETAGEIMKLDPKARIVILTSLYDHDTIEEINEVGLKYIIAKPIEVDQICKVLKQIEEDE